MSQILSTRTAVAVGAFALLLPLAACTSNNAPEGVSGADGTAKLTVDSTADACTLSAAEAPSGNVVFSVTNSGDDVTEFYLLAEDGLRIVSEVENIGPGLSRDLVVVAKPGSYITACKPGMVGDGIRSTFTVTDSGVDVSPTGELADQVALAATNYVAYVKDQSEQLLTGTEAFVGAYLAGDDQGARDLYAATRVHWERIEPVAESFGDLDPRMDLREADLEEGQQWTGWHLLEKDLWAPAAEANDGIAYVPLSPDQRTQYAEQLLADTTELNDRVHTPEFAETIDAASIGNGAKSLLDAQRSGDGFVPYTDLTTAQVKELADAVNALGEPLSRLTAAVVL